MLDCPFCRTPFTPDNDAAELARVRARVEKKDPVAINYLGEKYCHGEVGLQKDMRRAIELWEEAKQLGSVRALFNLGFAYSRGSRGRGKGCRALRTSGHQGHVGSRFNLGRHEFKKGEYNRQKWGSRNQSK